MKKILKICVFISLAIMVNCCTLFKSDNDSTGQVSQNSKNAAKLINQLSQYKVHVLGDNKSKILVLPNKTLFVSNSANFTPEAYQVFDLVLGFDNLYGGSSIAVTECAKNERDDFSKALVLERARKIIQHLNKSKVYANFIYGDISTETFCSQKAIGNSILMEFRDD